MQGVAINVSASVEGVLVILGTTILGMLFGALYARILRWKKRAKKHGHALPK